jgi:hypothetical protein
MEIATALEAMMALFTMPARKFAAASFVLGWKMLAYLANETWLGIHLSGRARRSTGEARLEINSHANGARTITAVRAAAA